MPVPLAYKAAPCALRGSLLSVASPSPRSLPRLRACQYEAPCRRSRSSVVSLHRAPGPGTVTGSAITHAAEVSQGTWGQ